MSEEKLTLTKPQLITWVQMIGRTDDLWESLKKFLQDDAEFQYSQRMKEKNPFAEDFVEEMID